MVESILGVSSGGGGENAAAGTSIPTGSGSGPEVRPGFSKVREKVGPTRTAAAAL